MERESSYLENCDDDESNNSRSDMKPDRSMTDFYCKICDAHMYSEQTWEAHVTGKRHLKNLQRPEGEMPSKIRSLRISKRAQLMDVIKEVEEPVVGLDFMTELERADHYLKPSYTCHLCQAHLTWSVVMDHILDTKHRLAYIKAVDREAHDQMVSLQLSKDNFEALVEDQSAIYEKERGQGSLEVKLEKPKMSPPLPRQENMPFPPSWNPSFCDWTRRTPQVSPERSQSSRSRRSPSRSPKRSRRSSSRKIGHISPVYFARSQSSQSRSPSPRSSRHASTSRRSKLPDNIEALSMSERNKLLRRLFQTVKKMKNAIISLSVAQLHYRIKKLSIDEQNRVAQRILNERLSKLQSKRNCSPTTIFDG